MGFRTRLVEILGGSGIKDLIKEAVVEKLKEQDSSMSESVRNEKEDAGWRLLTQRGIKYFDPLTQAKMFKICYWLYDKNGLAHRFIEREVDFIVSDGVTYTIRDEQVKEVIDKHWEDPDNNWELLQYQSMRELAIYGEQEYPTFVNSYTGHVKLGYIDPEAVTSVIVHPENVKRRVKYNYTQSGSTGNKSKTIINPITGKGNKWSGYLDGESFYFSINNVLNAPRGRSDLFTNADAIDSYERFLFNQSERAEIATRIIYDLKMQGKTQKQIDEILRKYKLPDSNTFWGHNEKVELSLKVPELGSQDASNMAKLLLNHIFGGFGMPSTWFAQGEGLTKGTAMVMDMPTKKQLKTRQRYFKWMLSYILRYVIHQAIMHETLTVDKKDTKVTINLPKIEEKETQALTTALVNLTNSLTVAVEEEWITKEKAKEVYIYMLSYIGKEIEPDEDEEIKEEMDPKLKQMYLKLKQEYMRKKKAEKIETEEEEEED